MYITRQIIISGDHPLYGYLDDHAHMAKLLYNAALFRIRQIFTGYGRDLLSDNEKEIFSEVRLLEAAYPSIRVKRVIGYSHLEKLMRVTGNPDYFRGLPMQTAQHVLKKACQDFSSWLKALRKYKASPEDFRGKPRMPHYVKSDTCTFGITNQDAVLYPVKDETGSIKGYEIKLPKTKVRHMLTGGFLQGNLKEMTVKPYYGRYILGIVMEVKSDAVSAAGTNMAGIDFGIDNIAAIACTDGSSVIYKGGAILSENRKNAILKAKYTGMITKGHNMKSAHSSMLESISFRHANFCRDQLHKISTSIVRWCLRHEVGILVLGTNRYWKQNCSLGKVNNRNFTAMPIARLREMIIYKAETCGMTVSLQEESYTSRADITAMDYIPLYGKDDAGAIFSGKRIRRGLYRCHNGLLVNADLNAAANILRKAVPDAWKTTDDFRFLSSPEVSGFHELNPQSIVQRLRA